MPFLLPLLLQLGFDFTPFQSGLFTVANVVGAMGMKTIIPIALRKWGFRKVLTVNAILSSIMVGACALFVPGISSLVMLAILAIGGFFRSLEFTSLNTISYADIEQARMSRATTLVSVGQQLSISVGVAVGALVKAAKLSDRLRRIEDRFTVMERHLAGLSPRAVPTQAAASEATPTITAPFGISKASSSAAAA